jgi:hypothetical protein
MNPTFPVGTREAAVEFPHMMSVVPYVFKKYGVPLLAYQKEGSIYNYTDANGLLGIIKTQELWTTHTGFLNDRSEIRFTIDNAIDVFSEKGRESPTAKSLFEGIERPIRVR